jgi:catechol-2,3-dioxygenase
MSASGAPPSTPKPRFNGINHLKLPVKNIHDTLTFYTKVLPFEWQPKWNHFTPDHELFAVMFTHGDLIVEARHLPDQAEQQRGWDPITWGVPRKSDLEDWAARFDEHGVKHSKIFTGIKGWVMGAEDPDGKVVRLYVDEEDHEWTNNPDEDEFWLGVSHADPDPRTKHIADGTFGK